VSRKVFIKPPAPTRSMLIAQMVITGLFLPFGILLTSAAEGEAGPYAAFFAVIWVIACCAIFIHALRVFLLLRRGKIEIAEVSLEDAGRLQQGFASRLRDIEALKKDGLISEDEYLKKRDEIFHEKW
jgi:hypothetical protein